MSMKEEDGKLMTRRKKSKAVTLPATSEIETALKEEKIEHRFWSGFRSTAFLLVVVAAAAALTAVMLMPVLRIYGSSMQGTIDKGNLVVCLKTNQFKTGDIVAFYYNNNVLVKRVIAHEKQWVNIDKEGNVYVDNEKIDEPYLSSKAYGDTNITLPYQVPEGKLFVMGDNRAVSIDSRNTSVGCVSSEKIIGKIIYRVWPLAKAGPVN